MTTGHARLAPSSLARTIQCPGSVVLQEMHPETADSASAAEGTACHGVAQETIAGRPPAEGSLAPNGVPITEDMLEAVEDLIDTIESDLKPYGMTLADVAVESPVSIPEIHAECWGTPDYRAWVPAARTPRGRPLLMVWDLKYGRRLVEAIDNPQLAAYASGCLSAAGADDLNVDVVLSIFQPRAYHRYGVTRWWKAAGSDLRAMINIANAAATEALGPNPRTRTGPECEYCTARHACETLQRVAYVGVDMAGSAQPLGLPPQALGLELRTLMTARDRLDARITGLEEQAAANERAGMATPGFKFERGLGRQVWAKPAGEVIALAAAFGKDVSGPLRALTPKQALKAGMDAALVAAMSIRPQGEAKLVIDDGMDARRVFS